MTINRIRQIAALACAAAVSACATPDAELVYRGASVWNGGGFEVRDLAVSKGKVLSRYEEDKNTHIVDIKNRFILPALANGHQHLTYPNKKNSEQFLDAGVFYVWNPNILNSVLDKEFAAFFARSDTADVKVSGGGITEKGSHPEPLYVRILGPNVYGGKGYDELYKDAFLYGRNRDEIIESLDQLDAVGVDFVKIYLLGSEKYEAPGPDGAPNSTTGLNPANVPFLVEQAHARNLPVVAHIETRHDFRVAVDAGVDFAGHLPGYGVASESGVEARRLTDDDIAVAVESGIKVMPTYQVGGSRAAQALAENPEDEEAQRRAELTMNLQRDNLERLHEAGVPVIAGTDLAPGLLRFELERWEEIGAMSRADVLKRAVATGPALFPERKIGCLKQGCEADFIVLTANPRENLDALDSIVARAKAGGITFLDRDKAQ